MGIILESRRLPWALEMNRLSQSLSHPLDGRSILDLEGEKADLAAPVDLGAQSGPVGHLQPRPVSSQACPFRTVPLKIPNGLPLIPFESEDSEAAEQYRILRTNIRQHPANPKVIAISSPMPGDGKTITSINAAAVLAMKEGSRVLLIDGDLRQRAVGRSLGLEVEFGLSDLIQGDCGIDQAIVRIERIPNLHVLTTGAVDANASELLDSDAFRALVERLRREFSYIVFDTTPIGAVADNQLVQQVCDGLILVVRPDYTNRSEFQKALEVGPREKLLGIVINAFQEWFLYRQPGSYYYRRPGVQQPAASRRGLNGGSR